LNKLAALISPAGEDYLEQMARLSHQLTLQRFGRTIQLYAPLYLSNYCINGCLYCGYSTASKCERTRLSLEEALEEAEVIASEGFRHILLVSSEDKEFITVNYLASLAEKLRSKFSSISMEVYSMSQEQYARLYRAGIDGVTLYQETYNRKTYAYFHPAGPKADYNDRLAATDRFAQAGMRRVGIGALLGLSDWRIETLALAEHAHYLMKRYWRAQISFSLPRICTAYNVSINYENLLSDRNLVQMMLALRLCFADAGIVISTRERAELRDRLLGLGVTRMSAGSKTSPGGYTGKTGAVKQFEIDDGRRPAEVAAMIKSQGFEAVWKDWDAAFGPD
jgi:2-iminoacetate synthase